MAGSVRKERGLIPLVADQPAPIVTTPSPAAPAMKVSRPEESTSDFHVLETTPRVQTATLLLRHDEASGPVAEAHAVSDQVILILQGEVAAEVGNENRSLATGDSIIVPAGTKHRFHNNSREAALVFTVYAPPAYPEQVS